MSRCSQNKIGYYTESEVQEALIRSHIRFVKAATTYYCCHECGEYHLTSRGERHPLLDDPEIKKRIETEHQQQVWAERYGRR